MSWEEIAKAKGHIFCQERECWCMKVDWNTGNCTAESCYHDDIAYVERQKQIEKRRQENHKRMAAEAEEERKLQKNIKKQNKTVRDKKLYEIDRLRRLASLQREQGHYVTANKLDTQANAILWEINKKYLIIPDKEK